MKRIVKPLAAAALTGALILSTTGAALAYSPSKTQTQADALKTLNLFQGSDKGYELERAPSRMEALIMLLRMTGQETEARFYEGKHPFTDAPGWGSASAYIGFAYENGLTKGVSADRYDPNAAASAQTYVALMLRALGYEANTAWNEWETLGKKVGLLPYGVDTKNFLRGDAVMISYAALDCKLKDGSMTLEEKLLAKGTFDAFSKASADLLCGMPVSKDSSLALIMASVYRDVSEYLTPDRMIASEITQDNMAYFLGVDTLKIKEGLAVEPMIRPAAHSVCLVRLADGEDVEKAKKAIAENVNPYKWICAGVDPENVRVDNIGNLIILVMDNSFADALVANFKALPADAKGAVLVGDTVVEKQALSAKSVTGFADKINAVHQKYLKNNQVFYSIVPDKSYYLRQSFAEYLDHGKLMEQLAPLMSKDMTRILLESTLDASDYYKTDRHWRQEKLEPTVKELSRAMGFTVDWSAFQARTGGEFTGNYARLLDSLKVEPFTYLESAGTKATKVSLYGKEGTVPVYDTAKLETNDPYAVFLSELSPVTVLDNPTVKEKRELVLFTDSFGTSLAPLLLDRYSKITLVDLRFVASELLPELVDFSGAQVLFLYSDVLVNNSNLLK